MAVGDGPVLDAEDERMLVTRLTRQVLADTAPEEIAAFDAYRAGFLTGGAVGEGHGREDPLGFGVEASGLLTPYVVVAATAAIRLLAATFPSAPGAEAKVAAATWLRRLLDGNGDISPSPSAVLARVREATFQVCRRTGVDPADALLVSDAVVGRLSSSRTSVEHGGG
ncbi:hypothetical protein [Actinoplanes sp. NPDC049316]|uniref:hypothetical protein n=1 Tax=Actinoplanes sp. NPDC049316 TaxID=3154727 RepID=UPI003438B6A9